MDLNLKTDPPPKAHGSTIAACILSLLPVSVDWMLRCEDWESATCGMGEFPRIRLCANKPFAHWNVEVVIQADTDMDTLDCRVVVTVRPSFSNRATDVTHLGDLTRFRQAVERAEDLCAKHFAAEAIALHTDGKARLWSHDDAVAQSDAWRKGERTRLGIPEPTKKA